MSGFSIGDGSRESYARTVGGGIRAGGQLRLGAAVLDDDEAAQPCGRATHGGVIRVARVNALAGRGHPLVAQNVIAQQGNGRRVRVGDVEIAQADLDGAGKGRCG